MSGTERTIEERLAAWLDGELSPGEAAEIEAMIEADPSLAERAADWRANDAAIAGAFAPIAEAPVDEAMLARLGLSEPARPQPLAANDNLPWWRRHALPIGGALAASLALVAFLGLRGGGPDPLGTALDTTPSGQVATLADGSRIEPVLTVKSRDGRWCREFRRDSRAALACRSDEGWKVEAQGGEAASQSGEFGLATGEDDPALEAAYDRLGAGDPVDAAAERALITKKWGSRQR